MINYSKKTRTIWKNHLLSLGRCLLDWFSSYLLKPNKPAILPPQTAISKYPAELNQAILSATGTDP